MRDWQTWFVIGLGMCWFWSRFRDSGVTNVIGDSAHINDTEEENPSTVAGGRWDDIENVLAFL